MAEAAHSTPHVGDGLVLDDGRRFTIEDARIDEVGGWWFVARADDGRTRLEGNLRLAWDDRRQLWRVDPEPPVAQRPAARRMRRTDRERTQER